jgi:hypothetical protein
MYKALGILLLLSGLIGGLWKFADYCGDTRETEVRLEFAKKEEKRDKETLRLQQLLSEQKRQAEIDIAEGRKQHDKGSRIVERIVDNCIDRDMPADGLGVLEADGIYNREE